MMEALGRSVDVVAGIVPVDLAGGAATGNRVSLVNADGVTIVYFTDPGTASEDVTITLQEHDAGSGGTSQNLAIIDHYYTKSAASDLDGSETWSEETQTAAATVTDVGENSELIVIEVDASSLSDGFTHVSVNTSDPGATAGKLGAVVYLLRDLSIQRTPSNLASPQ